MTTGIEAFTPSSHPTRRSLRIDPIRTGPIPIVSTAAAAPLTRRAAREADRAAVVRAKKPGMKRTAVSVAVMTLTAGLFGTMALPAFAQSPDASATATGSSASAAAATAARTSQSQTVAVGSSVATASVARDNYTTTAPVVKIQTATTATASTLTSSATAAAEAKRASFSASTAYTGTTAAEYLANPAHPAFSLAAVYQTALKYVGTPYVFGGATPAGFDCSGFVMYVYAQYGISLQHSVPLEDAAGTPISEADAQPGDLVVLDNEEHIGFYAGNGMILDAPKPGGSVSVRPLWTTAVHFVRLGIK